MRTLSAAAPALVLVFAIATFAIADATYDWDDAYISYRYAANLAEGHGPVYNAPDRVYGTTTLGWCALLAGFSRLLRLPVDAVATVLSFALLCVNALLVFSLVRRAANCAVLGVLAAVAMLVAPKFATTATSGMETMLYVFTILAAFSFATTGRALGAGAFAGLAFTVRPDGLAVIAALGLATLAGLVPGRERPVPGTGVSTTRWRVLRTRALALTTGFALVVLPFAAWCHAYYGSFLPHTLDAKREHVKQHGDWMVDHFLRGPGRPVLAAFGLAALLALGAALRRRSRATLAPLGIVLLFGLWQAVYAGAWIVAGIDMYLWYVGAMGAAAGVAVVAPAAIAARLFRSRIPAAVLGLAAVAAVGWWADRVRTIDLPENRAMQDALERPRHWIGEAIARYCDLDREVVGIGAIGAIGYHARPAIVNDWAHLVTRRGEEPEQTMFCVDSYTGIVPTRRLVFSAPALRATSGVRRFVYADPKSTWDHARGGPRRPQRATIAPGLHLHGTSRIADALRPGRSVVFEVHWTFEHPLVDGQRLIYALARGDAPPIARVETTGLHGNAIRYTAVVAGRRELDVVKLPLPSAVPSGEYRLTVSLAASDAAPILLDTLVAP